MSIELKIKSKHLSEEAKIIRFEERKLKAKARWERQRQGHATADATMNTWHSLNRHRRQDVRNENRATFLARAILKGQTYAQVEQKRNPSKDYDFNRVLTRATDMLKKYDRSGDWDREKVVAWVEAAA